MTWTRLAVTAALITGLAGQTYLMSPPHKAFALSRDGHFGWQSGQRTTELASGGALKFCRQSAKICEVVFVDDASILKSNLR